MRPPLIASRRHLLVVLGIIAVLTVAGIRQSRALAGSAPPGQGHVWMYAILVGMQLLWLRYIHVGMRAAGHSLVELTGGWWRNLREFGADVGVAGLALLAAQFATDRLAALLAGPRPNTAFLLPHGVLDVTLWVLVSGVAGFCEEVVFRGYLQRQFTALTGSALLGVLLQALAFGVSHGYQGSSSIATTAVYGLMLGLLAWWRGNVRAAAITHAATDILGGLLGH